MSESTETTESQMRRISSCTGCQAPLPLRLTQPGERPIAWKCTACGTVFSAVLDDTAEAATHRNVRVSEKLFSDCYGQSPPQGMLRFLEEIAQRDVRNDRREQKRYTVAIRAIVIPVDERCSPVGEAFTAMTLNISQSGLALLHTRAVNDRYLLVELDDKQKTQVVLEVVRSEHVGRFYDIAGRFVTRLGVSNSASGE